MYRFAVTLTGVAGGEDAPLPEPDELLPVPEGEAAVPADDPPVDVVVVVVVGVAAAAAGVEKNCSYTHHAARPTAPHVRIVPKELFATAAPHYKQKNKPSGPCPAPPGN